jgi:hypothetical protein
MIDTRGAKYLVEELQENTVALTLRFIYIYTYCLLIYRLSLNYFYKGMWAVTAKLLKHI